MASAMNAMDRQVIDRAKELIRLGEDYDTIKPLMMSKLGCSEEFAHAHLRSAFDECDEENRIRLSAEASKTVSLEKPTEQVAGIAPRALKDSVSHEAKPALNRTLTEVTDPPTAAWIAEKYIGLGCYAYFLPQGTKACTVPNWTTLATRDLAQAKAIAGDRHMNVMLVGKRDGVWALEFDDVSILDEYERLHGVINTRRHRSVSGGVHLLFLPSEAAWSMGNIEESDSERGELWSARIDNRYVLAPGSLAYPDNDTTKPLTFYEAINQLPIIEAPVTLLEFLKARAGRAAKGGIDASPNGAKIPHGSHDTTLFKIACKLRQIGLEEDGIYDNLVEVCVKRCVGYGSDYLEMCHNKARQACKYPPGTDANLIMNQVSAVTQTPTNGILEMTGDRLSDDDIDDEYSEASIPPFDPSVMKGIYKEIVDELIRGTTLQPQFIYTISKTIVGAKMSGKVKFADLDIAPLIYLALIGRTGSGKGEAWRRMLQVLKAKIPGAMPISYPLSCSAGLKIINSADSGAGLKDAFFVDPPDQPIACYVDEVTSLGHKAGEKKNPEILDTMGELADSTSISRVKAANGRKVAKTKDDAYLAVVLCGQGRTTYVPSFIGRTEVGWWDRLTPEHGVPQETGDLPPISDEVLSRLLKKLNGLPYSGTMTMSTEAKACLEQFWATQSPEVRKVARLKKGLKLDAYLMAFGRGLKVVELEDVEDAIKIFVRQLVIRRVTFRGEAPSRVGYYLGLIKELTQWMRDRLADGIPEAEVARSWRDYERKSNAGRNNEEDIFERAMGTHAKRHLRPVQIKSKNGHTYERYLPLLKDE